MAVQSDKLEFSQPDNAMSKIAEEQRRKLFARNDFKENNQYSTVHPDAIGDGDANGKGTGSFLDIYNENAGSSVDRFERKDDLKINKYSTNNPYYLVK
jgi:hypothetical protein